jgi:anti-anti-sigma factor
MENEFKKPGYRFHRFGAGTILGVRIMDDKTQKDKQQVPSISIFCDKPPIFDKAYAGDRCMVGVAGELRQAYAESLFKEAVLVYKSGVKDLILDFRRLEYADTAGLQNLVRIFKYSRENEGLRFAILAQPGDILDILKTCRFDKFIRISQDEDEFKDNWRKR